MTRVFGAVSAAPNTFPHPISSKRPAFAAGFPICGDLSRPIANPPVPALDFVAWDRQEREHTSRVDELLPANKTTLFDALAAANITIVVVTFDGYGDSGQIENIEVKAGTRSSPC